MKREALMTHDKDSVATALTDLSAGNDVSFECNGRMKTMKLVDAIPFGHKFALVDIPEGGDVLKYGEVIGRATEPIRAGAHVHVHNLESLRGRGDLAAGRTSAKGGQTS
ncbi:UxaA family hydrolase [Aminivibrio sp.]|uniref:UxaA family hydrolase n=1 Tax=Aminivibrio sp. TaxID=1872489 RepID=UPI001A5A4D32|nr:UxaA family hydrolase [Aminivibrio sp.]MBL3540265.1 UxaA family hydrolase [Aminivibrio sp.]